jgi:hypothetical protein
MTKHDGVTWPSERLAVPLPTVERWNYSPKPVWAAAPALPSGEGRPQGHENALVDLAVLEAAERGVVGGGGTKPGTLS